MEPQSSFTSLAETAEWLWAEGLRWFYLLVTPGWRQYQLFIILGLIVLAWLLRALAAPRLAWALIAEPVEPEVDAERLRYRAAYAALYQRVLDQGVAAGELPPQSTALAAAALVGAIAEALVGPLAAPLNDAGLADHLAAFCLRAVGVAGAASVAGSGDTESAP